MSNRLIVGLISTWFGLAICVFAWFSLENRRFQTEWQASATQLNSRFEKAKADFADTTKNADQMAVQQALTAFADDLAALKLPQAPQLLGFSLGVEKTRAKHAAVSQSLPVYIANLRTTALFIDYQQKVAITLEPLGYMGAETEGAILALAQKWQVAAEAVKNTAPPSTLLATHQAMLDSMQNIHDTALRLAALFKADNEAEFKTVYEELTAYVAKLRELSASVSKTAEQLDTERGTLFASIQQNL